MALCKVRKLLAITFIFSALIGCSPKKGGLGQLMDNILLVDSLVTIDVLYSSPTITKLSINFVNKNEIALSQIFHDCTDLNVSKIVLSVKGDLVIDEIESLDQTQQLTLMLKRGIKGICSLKQLSQLEELSIYNLNADTFNFDCLPKGVRRINLYGGNINHVICDTPERLKELEYLSINGSKISVVTEGIYLLPSLREMSFFQNNSRLYVNRFNHSTLESLHIDAGSILIDSSQDVINIRETLIIDTTDYLKQHTGL